MELRYIRNASSLNADESALLRRARVCIIGCGGLGGYTIEMLARIGIGEITAVDGDAFEETNLNRQILSKEDNLGKNKAVSAGERVKEINSYLQITVRPVMLDELNAKEILSGHDVVVDAVDNIQTRLLLEQYCETLQIPLVHGAIAGWYGRVTTVFPGDRTLQSLYLGDKEQGIEKEAGVLSFTPGIIGAIQASETIKLVTGKGDLLRKKLLLVDLLNNEYEVIKIIDD